MACLLVLKFSFKFWNRKKLLSIVHEVDGSAVEGWAKYKIEVRVGMLEKRSCSKRVVALLYYWLSTKEVVLENSQLTQKK